jgi:hypothetical protein
MTHREPDDYIELPARRPRPQRRGTDLRLLWFVLGCVAAPLGVLGVLFGVFYYDLGFTTRNIDQLLGRYVGMLCGAGLFIWGAAAAWLCRGCLEE